MKRINNQMIFFSNFALLRKKEEKVMPNEIRTNKISQANEPTERKRYSNCLQ